MSYPKVIYRPRSDASPEAELGALVEVYKLALAKEKGNPIPAALRNDGTKTKEDSADGLIVPHPS